MCKTSEIIVRQDTRKIILTTSTLYNVWGISSLNLLIHIDIGSIVGGRIRDLSRALSMIYLIHAEKLKIIITASLNNIGDNQPDAEMPDALLTGRQAGKYLTIKTYFFLSLVCIYLLPLGNLTLTLKRFV